jgi:hypothetical protein
MTRFTKRNFSGIDDEQTNTKPSGSQREFGINLLLSVPAAAKIEGPMNLLQISASASFFVKKRVPWTYLGGKSGPRICITG